MLFDIERVQDFATGELLRHVVADTDTNIVTAYERGVFVGECPLTADERERIIPKGLPPDGKIVTALAVLGLLPTESAAALVGLPAQALVDEALAWGAASATN